MEILKIQDDIFNALRDFSPCTLFYSSKVLSITFKSGGELLRFLEFLNYQNQCDQDQYEIFGSTSTVILLGSAIQNLMNRL